MTPQAVIEIALHHCGNRAELAEHLGVSKSYIDKMRTMDAIPAKHCNALYRLTRIPMYKMNPVFPYRSVLKMGEERMVAQLRHLKDRELLRDIQLMLDMEVGDVDLDEESK